jgi:hypothetical protein
VSFQHARQRCPEGEIGVADNRRRDGYRTILPASALGGNALRELRLADWLHLLGAVLAIHGIALDKDRGDDIVPATGVQQQFVEEIAIVGAIPEMMMGIANRKRRL